MKKVDKPVFNAKNTFLLCINNVRDSDLKKRLLACKDLIEQAEIEFDQKATGNLFTIHSEKIVNGNVSAEELVKVYTQRMAKKGVPGRNIYDKLISAPKLGICPLCSQRLVETLDHYLPKSDFPRLTTSPLNLVPSCYNCNKSKLTITPCRPEDETFHPYYDNIEEDEWLSAKVNKTTPPTITFFVSFPQNWSDLLKERVKNHFDILSLNKLYSTHAAVLIRNLNYRLTLIYNKLKSDGLKKYLKDEADSRYIYDRNSWQTAFYKAISIDEWFCNGGFKLEI